MRRSTKALLTAALMFFIAGAATGLASLCAGFDRAEFGQAIGDGRFELIGPEKLVRSVKNAVAETGSSGRKFAKSYEDVESMNLTMDAVDCTIIPCEGDEWRVEGDHLPEKFRCILNNGKLRVDCENGIWSFLPRGRDARASLEIYVPRDQAVERLEITTGVGALRIGGDGDFLRCGRLNLECGVGETDIFADVSKKAEIEGGVGQLCLTLAGRPEEFDYKIECGVGGITIGEHHYSGLGSEHKLDNGADRKLEIECGVGAVEVAFAQQDYMEDAGVSHGADHEEDHWEDYEEDHEAEHG